MADLDYLQRVKDALDFFKVWADANFAWARVDRPAEPFTPPEPDRADPQGSAWMRWRLQSVLANPLSVGQPWVSDERGNVLVQVFTPNGTGQNDISELARDVIAAHDGQTTTNGMLFQGGWADSVPDRKKSAWTQINVTIPYRFTRASVGA